MMHPYDVAYLGGCVPDVMSPWDDVSLGNVRGAVNKRGKNKSSVPEGTHCHTDD
jgi:hypothetical protein